MNKSKQQKNYLETILEASKTVKTKSELSRASGITVYFINKILDENPVQKTIVLESLNKNKKKGKSNLTPEQKEIYDMFMKMAFEKKTTNHNKKEHYAKIDTKINNKKDLHNTSSIISLPIEKCLEEDAVSIKLKNDLYNKNSIVTNAGKERFKKEYKSVLLHVGDNIYSVRFFFNNTCNYLSFRHLKVVSLERKNNAKVIYSKTIYSKEQLNYILYRYQDFVKKFVDKNLINF